MYRYVVGIFVLWAIAIQLSYASSAVHHRRHRVVASTSAGTVVDINRAGVGQFAALHGLGVKKAQHIIDYRKAHGRFKSVAALTSVKGVGAKLLAKLEKQNPGKLVVNSDGKLG